MCTIEAGEAVRLLLGTVAGPELRQGLWEHKGLCAAAVLSGPAPCTPYMQRGSSTGAQEGAGLVGGKWEERDAVAGGEEGAAR